MSSKQKIRSESRRSGTSEFPDLFLKIDFHGTITESQAGKDAQECSLYRNLTGKTLQSLLPKRETSAFMRCLGQVQEKNTASSLEFSDNRSGKEFFFEARLYPYQDDQIVAIIRDITERKMAERVLIKEHRKLETEVEERTAELTATLATLREAEERYRSVFEHSMEGIYIADLDGRFVEVNEAMAGLLGYKTVPDLFRVSSMNKYDSFVDMDKLKEFLRQVRQGRVEQFEYEVEQVSGKRIWVSESARLHTSPDGRNMVLEGIVHDITARKEKEEADRKRIRAELANKTKDEFLSHISHEMRTPMQIISGIGDLLRTTSLDTKQARYVRMLRSSSEMMTRFVNDLLDFSRLEAGRLQLESEPFSMMHLVEEIVECLVERFSSKGLEFVCHLDPCTPGLVWGDAPRLRQVLFNLLTNAAKFTHAGEVILSLAYDREKKTCRFAVHDSGIGIKPEHVDTIFESFVQGDANIATKYGGTGLGLAISQRLVSLMGGTLGVESTPGRGSMFFFDVELAPVEDSGQSIEPLSDLRDVKILLLDDSAMARDAVTSFLTTWGGEVHGASELPAAQELLRQAREEGAPFQCVLLDETLPDLSSHEVIEVLRTGFPESTHHIVLLSSAEDREKNPFTWKTAGVVGTITKPVLPHALVELVNGLVQEMEPESASPQPRPFDILVVHQGESSLQNFFAKTHHALRHAAEKPEALSAVQNQQFDYIFLDLPDTENSFAIAECIRSWERKEGRRAVPVIMVLDMDSNTDMGRCLRSGCTSFLLRPVGQSDILDVLERYLPFE